MVPDGDAMLDTYRNKDYEAQHRLTCRIRGETNNAATRRQIGRKRLMDDMRKVVKQLIKHAAAVDETMELIESTVKAYQGRLLNSKKIGLVGACIYYLSAKHQLGISIGDICKSLGIKMKIISISLKQVKELCPNFEYERPDIKDLVRKYVDEMANKCFDSASLRLGSPIKVCTSSRSESLESIPLIDNKDKIVLQNRVMLLLDLFEAMHPYNQPSPQSMITAVIYHAWRSLDTFKLLAVNLRNQNISLPGSEETLDDVEHQQIDRKVIRAKHSLSFEKFCQLCNLKYSSNGYKIVSKLQSSLLQLGRHLGDVNKINLPWFLKDIIENSPHLIQEHMRSEPTPRDQTDES